MHVVDLAAYLEGEGFENVQQFQMQLDPDVCIALVGYAGRQAEGQFGVEAPAFEFPRVQVQVRGAQSDAQEPAERAYRAWHALHLQLRTLNGTRYRRVAPLQPPFWLKQDTNRRHYFAFNVDVDKDVDTV